MAVVRLSESDFVEQRAIPNSKRGGQECPPHMSCASALKGWLVAVVVVLVPVAFGVPAVLVLIPPAMLFTPATLPRFVQFTTLVVGLRAVPSVSLDGLVEFVLGVNDSALAVVDVFCVSSRHCG